MANKKILLLVESPNKVLTVKEILKEDNSAFYTVKASVGHISYIKDSGLYNMGIDVNNKFKSNYQVMPDKKKVVEELKHLVSTHDEVYLCSDDDREGEAISYSLKKFLNIPKGAYKRITFHEITKQAVLKAIQNPRDIDMNLVDAAHARAILDKIVGYRLSPISRQELNAKSVGRCQSAGLKLLVEREEEIINFKPETFFDLYLHFDKNKVPFKAKYSNDKGESISLKSKSDCDLIASECKGNSYIIKDIVRQNQNEFPQPPFTTSTFQQEASKRLGISIEVAMAYAQKLFEGINVGGKHIALTTYLRTDDASFAPDFLPILENYVKSHYGEEYYAPVKKAKKQENAQEGHECFRVIDLDMTPSKLATYIQDDNLIKIYTIIYNRTLAASMKPAIYSTTKYIINNKNHFFAMNSKELVFDGYRKIYNYRDEDEKEEIVKETFNKNEVLQNTNLEAVEKQTNPPKRYTEASFIKELDKRGIGRPSTFQSILSTLKSKDRGYCSVEKKELIPTKLGMDLSHFLDNNFGDIINLNYTKEMEEDLDLIANNKLNYIDFLTDFYSKLEASINKVKPNVETEEKCPICGAPMKIRRGPKGKFLGCSKYPSCKGTKNLN